MKPSLSRSPVCTRTRTWISVLVAALVILYAKEAWVSGSHYVRFLEPNFIYEYDDGTRKSFYTSQDANEYFASKQKQSTQAFAAALPLFAQFFQEARQNGIHLGELRLRTLDLSELGGPPIKEAEQLLFKDDRGYPRLVRLDLNAGVKDAYDVNNLTVLLEKALTPKQASWLLEHVSGFRYATLSARASAMASVSEQTGKQFKAGFSAVRLGKNFALAVGLTDEIRPENEARLSAQAEALIKELFPTIQKAFQSEEMLKNFFAGDSRQLISLEEKLGKRPEGAALASLFNPFGPLLDSVGMRTSGYVGALKVTLLFVVKEQWAARPTDPRPTNTLTVWLQRIGDGPERDDAAFKLQIKKAEDGRDPAAQNTAVDELVRLAKDPALRIVGGQRVIDYLVQHALSDPARKDPMRKLAIENLRWIECPERRRVYFELIKTRRTDGIMSVIGQDFGNSPDEATTAALISVLHEPQASEDSRKWAKYGLQSQMAKLTREAVPGTAALQEKVKQALANTQP